MITLSEAQIDFISNDIRAKGIKNEGLAEDLLDHICCILEADMKPGDDFISFYEKTVQTFYKAELNEIQEEIQVLKSNKYYYQMKKFSKMLGLITLSVAVIGVFFRTMSWTGGAPIIFIGSILFNLWLLLQYAILSNSDRKKFNHLPTNTLGLMAAISVVVASLFKIMHWPYTDVLLLISSSLFAVFILFITSRMFRKQVTA